MDAGLVGGKDTAEIGCGGIETLEVEFGSGTGFVHGKDGKG